MGRDRNNWTSAHIELLLWIELNITNLQTRAKEESRKVRVIKHRLSIVLTGFTHLFRIRRQFPRGLSSLQGWIPGGTPYVAPKVCP